MRAGGAGEEYSPPWLARALHALPHLNATLHRVNDTFAPGSSVYVESLGILGSLPGAWLILTLLVLLLYLLTRCCDRQRRPVSRITALKVSLMILSILCCGAVGVGLFGNDDLHNAMAVSLQEAKKLAHLVSTVNNQSETLEQAMGARARDPLMRLADVLDSNTANQTALGILLRELSKLRHNASAAAAAADNLRRPLAGLRLDRLLAQLWWWENVRWIGGMAGWCAGGAVCVALLAAAARRSRRALLLLSVAALAALVACWLTCALLLALCVAAADACQDPAAALALRAHPHLSQDMVHYYLSCKVSRENVLTSELRSAQRAVVAVRQALAVLSRGAPVIFHDPMLTPTLGELSAFTGEGERALVTLNGALECRASRDAFVAGARAACDAGLVGLALMLLASAVAGLLFTALVLLDSHAWIYIGTKRSLSAGEERAPFLTASNATTASSGSSASARTLPRPPQGSYFNGKPPSYAAAVQLRMDIDDDPPPPQRSRGAPGSSATLGRGAGGGGALAGAGAGAGSHTLGRLPPAHHHHNNGKYATLSKQCKTLESNDFY